MDTSGAPIQGVDAGRVTDDQPKPRRADRIKMSTRPQDWAAPARAHLFGMDTLNAAEREQELIRRAAYPDRYRAHR